MQYLKAFLAGFLFIVVFGLCIQLAYMFLAMWYIDLVKEFPWVATFGGYVSYLVGIVVYFLLMAMGGILTASIAKKNVAVMCFLVGISSTGLSVLLLQNFSEYIVFSILFVVSGILFTIVGGRYQKQVQA
jgi:hypothetical protein